MNIFFYNASYLLFKVMKGLAPYFRSSKLNKLLLNDCDEGKSELESSNELVSVLIEYEDADDALDWC